MRHTVQFFSGCAVLVAIFCSWPFALSFINRASWTSGLCVFIPVPITLTIYLAVLYLNRLHVHQRYYPSDESIVPRWFVPKPHSRCVDHARQNLMLTLDEQRACPLRHIAYCTAGSEWRMLEDAISDRPFRNRAVGEVAHCDLRFKNDPVRSYLVVRLWSDIHLEAVQFNADPTTTQLFVRGTCVGSLREERPPPVHGTQRWNVFMQEHAVGRVDLRYPIGESNLLSLRLNDATSLPFAIGYGSGTNLVIPPDAPEVADPDLSLLYFLVAIVVRRLILKLDGQTGD